MIDVDSDTWRDVLAFVAKQREKALGELLSSHTSFEQTQFVRGRLLVLAEIERIPADQNHGGSDPAAKPVPDLYF